MTWTLTAKQSQANELLAGQCTDVMLEGGSRSGKTALILRAIGIRAMSAPRSRHACFRFRQQDSITKLALDTFPAVMAGFFPGVPYRLNKEFWYAEIPPRLNVDSPTSEIWFAGLDDKERTEKVLGGEFATLFLNECSQIGWSSREMVRSRLAQSVKKQNGKPLPLRMYYDQNPPKKTHWTYRLFHLGVDPVTKRPLTNPSLYPWLRLNPDDNRANLPAEYIDTILGSMSARFQRRFRYGEYEDDSQGGLFNDSDLDKWRVIDSKLPDFQRIVVAVDPSGSGDTDNADNDSIGIVVAALGTDGNGYLLEDLTVKAGPATWGKVATDAYDRHDADKVVGETNYGGAMVRHVIETSRPRTPFRCLTATRGKVVRAEPVSSLVETGKIRLVGYFPELEEELAGFTTNGYVGDSSPNRADAFVWAFTELFPGMVRQKEPDAVATNPLYTGFYAQGGDYGERNENAWMGS